MAPLSELQQCFATALCDPRVAPPPQLRGLAGEQPVKRFAVYRNNVFVSLVEAIRASYGVVERIVGEAFFHAMARAYVGQDLPRSPVLLEYGAGFPAYIERFGPAANLPYLADVARLEWAWQEAYHAADAEPLAAGGFAEVPPEELGRLVLELHPALRLLRSPWPVLAIWTTNRHDTRVRPVAAEEGGEDVAILRPGLEVRVEPLPSGSYGFVDRLAAGAALEQAVAAAEREHADFELPITLNWLFQSGAIVGFRRRQTR